MLLPQNSVSWLSEHYEPSSESELSFTQARRGLRRFVLERIIFRNSTDNAELKKMAKDYEPVFRIAA